MTDSEKQVGTLDFFLRLAERFGVPVLILVAVLWMARDVAVSVHSTVVVPVVTAHTKFLETTQETLKEIGHTQEQQAETMQELANGQREIKSVLMVRPKDTATN
jgi:hypothetical protein